MKTWVLGVASAAALIVVVLALGTARAGGRRAVFANIEGMSNPISVLPQPIRTIRSGSQVLKIYNPTQLSHTPGVQYVKRPELVISGDQAGGLSIGGDVYAAKFMQNGHVLCAYGSGDSYTGGGAPDHMRLTISLFYGATGLAQSSPTTFGQSYMSTETDCVGVGDGIYTVYAYANAYWPNGTSLNAAGHTSV